MLTKESVKQAIDQMPETFSLDDLVEEIILLDKIDKARKELADGKRIEWDDFKKETDSWFEWSYPYLQK